MIRLLLLTCVLQIVRAGNAGEGPVPIVEVRMAKATYVVGEPVAVHVSITNPTRLDAVFPFNGPGLYAQPGPGPFFLHATTPGLWPLPASQPSFSMPTPRTQLAPGETWRGTAFLQELYEPPPVGEYRLEYDFESTYRLGRRELGQGDDPSLSKRGSLSFKVRPASPGDLERALDGYLKEILNTDSRSGRLRIHDAVDAMSLIEDPVAIPYLVKALDVKSLDGGWDEDRLYQSLTRFGDREDARRAVLGILRADSRWLPIPALEWLREMKVPIDVEDLRKLFVRAQSGGSDPLPILRYLESFPLRYSELRPEVMACLSSKDPVSIYSHAAALNVLAAWGCEATPEVKAAQRELAEALHGETKTDVAILLDTLARWNYRIDTADLSALLVLRGADDRRPKAALDYLRAVPLTEDRKLEPRVAALLHDNRTSSTVILLALDLLKRWGHSITAEETNLLLKRKGEGSDAVVRYLRKSGVQ